MTTEPINPNKENTAMIPIKTDDPKIAARYYQLHAELYEGALKKVVVALGAYFRLYKPELNHATMLMERLCSDLDSVLADRSIAEQVCKEFNENPFR